MNIDFEAYTVWGLVRGGIEADQPLHDLLNHETNVTVHDCAITPLTAGAVTERESAQIEVDDLLVVVAPPDVVAPIHASWNELMLGVGPYGVSGLLPTLPGYDPGRSLTRPSGHFVLLSNVAVSRIDRPSLVLARHRFAWVNRYAVTRVRSELELPYHFPGAEQDPARTQRPATA